MSDVLVTGGLGFIGSHLAEQLVGRGHEVTILDNLSHGSRDNIASIGGRLRVVKGDLLDPEALNKAVRGREFVFHLAANTSVNLSLERPSWSAEQNVLATIRLLEAARAASVKRVVFSSSAAVYGYWDELPIKETAPLEPASPYGLEKVTGEKYVKLFAGLSDMDTVSLRYFNVFGPRQNADLPHPGGVTIVIEQIRKTGRSQLLGDGRQTRDMIYVGNVVQANLLAMERKADFGGAAFNISTGKSVYVSDMHDMISGLMNAASEREYLPLPEGNIIHSLGDSSLARRELGFEAEVGLEEGLKRTIEWSLSGTASGD